MMRRLIYAILFLASISLQAQTFEKAVFTHKIKQKTRTLEAGDHLMIKYLNNGNIRFAGGTLQSVEDGVLYLTEKSGIPLDKVQRIRYRDPGLSKGVRITAIIGDLLIVVGFFWALAYIFRPFPPIVGLLLGIGIFLICSALIVQAIGTQRIRNASSAWDVETVMSAPPSQTP